MEAAQCFFAGGMRSPCDEDYAAQALLRTPCCLSAGEDDDMVIAAFKEQQRQYQTVLEGMKVQQCGLCIGQHAQICSC